MGKSTINWAEMDRLFAQKKGKNFSFSEMEYKNLTGRNLPVEASYLRNKSAFARYALEKGYLIEVETEAVRVLTLKKRKEE